MPGHRPGVPGTPGHPGGFQKINVIFSYVPFLLPISEPKFRTESPYFSREKGPNPEERGIYFGEGKWGRKKCRRIPKCDGDWQGRVPKCSLPRKTLQNKGFGAPNFRGICPKLFTALRGIHPYLCTPVLPRVLGSPRPSTEPKTPKPQKVSKKVSREVSGTPRDPQKVPKKVRKVQKIVDFNYFLDFSDFFGNFLGVLGGPRDLSGDFFGDFLGFRGFGLCRWPGRSQPKRDLYEPLLTAMAQILSSPM